MFTTMEQCLVMDGRGDRNEGLQIENANMQYELWQAVAQERGRYQQCGPIYSKLPSKLQHIYPCWTCDSSLASFFTQC